jgi:hypothetical protein
MYLHFPTVLLFVLAVILGVVITVYYCYKVVMVLLTATVGACATILSISLSKRH